eukprot:4553077-Amphidinium_carterae.2
MAFSAPRVRCVSLKDERSLKRDALSSKRLGQTAARPPIRAGITWITAASVASREWVLRQLAPYLLGSGASD